jgi:hypothetical protein
MAFSFCIVPPPLWDADRWQSPLHATVAIVEFFCWFRDDGKAIVVEPIDQRPERGISGRGLDEGGEPSARNLSGTALFSSLNLGCFSVQRI